MKKTIITSAVIAIAFTIGETVWLLTTEKFSPPAVIIFLALIICLPIILICLLVLLNIKLAKTGRILGAILACIIGGLAVFGIIDNAYHLYRHQNYLSILIESLVLVPVSITMLAYVIQAWRATGRTPATSIAINKVHILTSVGIICALLGAWGAFWCLDNLTITDRPETESNIAEIVLRHEFDNNGTGMRDKARAYCIEISDSDPSDKFLTRFKDHKPPVKKGSEFILGQDIKFSVYHFRWINNRIVDVEGSSYANNMNGTGHTYRIIRKKGRWVIDDIFNFWKS